MVRMAGGNMVPRASRGAGGHFQDSESTSFEVTNDIPESLKDRDRSSIRIESTSGTTTRMTVLHETTSSPYHVKSMAPAGRWQLRPCSLIQHSGIPTFDMSA